MYRKIGAAALFLSATVSSAWAQNACVRPPDMTALQVAAVQQRFAVAALACDSAPLYNSFVNAYRPELQKSDEALQAYFLRRNADTGMAQYHSFKTKLANLYSGRSAENLRAFCGNARASFDRALKGKKSLADIVSVQPISIDETFTSCGDSVPGGAMVARGPADAQGLRAEAGGTAAVAAALAPAGGGPPRAIAAELTKQGAETTASAANAASAALAQNSYDEQALEADHADEAATRALNSSQLARPPDPRLVRQRANAQRVDRAPYYRPSYPYGPGGYDARYDNRGNAPNPYARSPNAYGYYGGYDQRDPYYRGYYARPYRAPPPQYFYQGRP